MDDRLNCPRCERPLRTSVDFRGLIGGCDNCGGIWAEVKSPEKAARRPEAIELSKAKPRSDAPDRANPVRCPRCGLEAKREELGPITIDRCPRHGTWFDHGELLAVRAHLDHTAELQRAEAERCGFHPSVIDDQQYSITAEGVEVLQQELEREQPFFGGAGVSQDRFDRLIFRLLS